MSNLLPPLPPIDTFCIEGLEEGRRKGKTHHIADASIDHNWAAAEEIRVCINYMVGRRDKTTGTVAGPMERQGLAAALVVARTLYRIQQWTREREREGR